MHQILKQVRVSLNAILKRHVRLMTRAAPKGIHFPIYPVNPIGNLVIDIHDDAAISFSATVSVYCTIATYVLFVLGY